jgi:biopolymer transport protein TolQ
MDNIINILRFSVVGQNQTGSIGSMILSAGPVAKGVLIILLIMSIISWAIIIFKYISYKKISKAADKFMDIFAGGKTLNEAYEETRSLPASYLKSIFDVGYKTVMRKRSTKSDQYDESPVTLDIIERAMRKVTLVEVNKLEDLLSFLASTGSASPFIGLFGTVWGIMSAFRNIGITEAASLAVVAPGISEALITTAMGLFAAIPAVLAYNYFERRIKVFMDDMDAFIIEMLNMFERHLNINGYKHE